uniref:Uncharacterized protein n=1 Tax=Chromera velia CCMP2878 TaxID=1169474 RepID=A0A0G4HW16_9ALVE|eukprot:Cvel_8959.t1-p1 / transcript=Cvel_8959.t1 / gene=Cvel_8959 / organism=Chromera_velia_CCMP2878 / gene_product=hypothetical protein / transcript_product=hypothetical protein / location=Cvel_scaffold505:19689-19910(+) / protein_length=74 / sequence_SO=supercontig / SO=protein_coding / is_pseudo=false
MEPELLYVSWFNGTLCDSDEVVTSNKLIDFWSPDYCLMDGIGSSLKIQADSAGIVKATLWLVAAVCSLTMADFR